jgi:hypothetical protein
MKHETAEAMRGRGDLVRSLRRIATLSGLGDRTFRKRDKRWVDLENDDIIIFSTPEEFPI